MLRLVKFTFLVLFFGITPLKAQFSVCGKVQLKDTTESDATTEVILQSISNSSTYNSTITSNEKGEFCFKNVPSGDYLIFASHNTIHSDDVLIKVTKNKDHILLIINEHERIDDIVIRTKTRKESQKEHSIKTSIVDLEEKQLTATSVEETMNATPGIRVRNSGGIGGSSDLVVGGFSGKSVKFLIDGIPVDYLGSSMGITKIPTNIANYIEIYKGVLPTEIGVDALGAAVNIITKNPLRTSHQFSYRVGSFNTHQLTVSSFMRTSDKFSYGINIFGTYSDNNFKVDDLPYENEITGKTEAITARLFHNGYRQLNGEAYVNFEKRKWADLFKIKVNSFGMYRQLQNDFASRNRPYGEVLMKEYSYAVPSILYKKTFFDRKLEVSQFLVFSAINNHLVDTMRNGYYDWLGVKHENISGSETGTDFSNLKDPILKTLTMNTTYRGIFTYRFNKRHHLVLNLTDTYLQRRSGDLNNYNKNTLIKYNRFIAGLGYEFNLFDDRLQGMSQVKLLLSESNGVMQDLLVVQGDSTNQNLGVGLAQSLKYQTSIGVFVRASIENTYRLPDQMEIFGDNVFILPNLALKPEQSLNVNASIGYQLKRKFNVELNGYYRDIKDMIKLKEVTQFQANFMNLDKVRGYGMEIESWWEIIEGLQVMGNITYNEFRFKGANDDVSKSDHFINARVSNMPFYFGNAGISYQTKRLFTNKDNLKIYWNYSYVHQFYLDFIEKQYEPDGFLGLFGKSKVYTDRVIPIQHVHTTGLMWQMELPKEHKVAFSFEINNLFNQAVYNDFRMQSPGRSFYVKINYDI